MCLPEQPARDVALAGLARLDPAALDAALLMGQITGLATFISQAQGQMSRLTATLDAAGGAAEAGHKSASAFLRSRCGLARDVLRRWSLPPAGWPPSRCSRAA